MSNDYLFIKACKGQPVERTPIWIMRQAGRYMAEYREIRKKASFLEMCRTPELAAEVTLQPIDKLGVDAAILFSDILVLVEAMGIPLDFHENKGPILDFTIRNQADVDNLIIPDPYEKTPYVMDAIKILRRELEGRVPLIGFAGAPYTVGSYMIEGKTSKQFIEIKTLMFEQPQVMHNLLEKVTTSTIDYLKAQIEAGAQALQIFDSWAGSLAPRDFREFVLPYIQRMIKELKAAPGGADIPIIYFAQGNPAILPLAKETGCDVVGVDWRIEIKDAIKMLGDDVGIQGNLDPTCLFLPPDKIKERAIEVLDQVGGRPGHIFNLGHGILPPTPVEHAQALVDAVQGYKLRK